MKIYHVYWKTKHIDMVTANSEQEAIKKVINSYGNCFHDHSYFRVDK